MVASLRLALFAAINILTALQLTSATSLGQTLRRHGSLSLLHETLVKLDLLSGYEGVDHVTFLAMNNDAITYLADWGLNLTQIDPIIARVILDYHIIEGVHLSKELLRPSSEQQIAHSILRPPVFTNVSEGPAVKLMSRGPHGAKNPATLMAQSGLQSISKIVDVDLRYDSGIVHVIDRNLVLPHNISETTNLVNTLHDFWRLIDKSQSRELLEELADTTIFLPNDAAVREVLPALDSLTPKQLAVVIANHVVPNHVLYHTEFTSRAKKYSTLSGKTIKLNRKSEKVLLVDNANILEADILIYGGVAHVIDKVLLPEQDPSKYHALVDQLIFYIFSKATAHLSVVAAGCAIGLAVLKVRQWSLREKQRLSMRGHIKGCFGV
ncbi:hypothetical protein KVR01_009066 [Diaporthe batatas]|uniref:uncharacterized protein n=1 Tax=Diaporthe batatas TaxID=748121 RepID=UPI001D052549|nr:uncharacterized protein KVR01_009066 [Diaporthe batatas]KAG8160802.1 hypothetical protein KVR01_009066 [Diaporthe batatas]